MKIISRSLPVLIVAASLSFMASETAAQRASVSAAEVNGTFRMSFRGKFRDMSNELKVLALGRGRLRIAFDLIYPYTLQNNETMVNMGTLDGEATIVGDTAVYESTEFGKCKITFKFIRPGLVKVMQSEMEGSCGFGFNVRADGTYKKVSGKKPKFD